MTLRISLARAGALLAGTVPLLAQPWTGGAGYGGSAATGLGGGNGGPTLARVNVAPLAGGSQTVGLGAGGFGAPGAGAGGLFGVTRPTFMGEANAVAGQFFSNAGVPLAGVAGGVRASAAPLPAYAGQVRATPGAYAVRTRMPASPAPALSRAEVGASLATTSAAPEPAPALAYSPAVFPGSALHLSSGPSGTRPGLAGPGRATPGFAGPSRPRQRMVR